MTPHRFPPLVGWQAFENFCVDFFQAIWRPATIIKHGNPGEHQDGVDLYGLLTDSGWFGAQCKEKGAGKNLTLREMKREVAKAESFNPRLERYVFTTTAPRAAKVQAWARTLTETSPFEVTVFAWDDFCEALPGRHEIIERHFAGIVPPARVTDPDPAADTLEAYQHAQWGKLLVLPTLALGAGQDSTELLLTDVYTSLDVKETLHLGSARQARGTPEGEMPSPESDGPSISMPGEPAYLDALVSHEVREAKQRKNRRHRPTSRRCRALEAVAANRHLVLIGAPGGGKSTFGRFLVLSLLGESLGHDQTNLATLNRDGDSTFQPWPHGAPLPFFVELSSFVGTACFPTPGAEGEAQHLVDYLIHLGPSTGRFDRVVRAALKQPNGLLIVLDGLDETPNATDVRSRLREVIDGFARTYPHARVLVTSRPYAYEAKSPWRLDNARFASVELAPFDLDQQSTFVEAWYHRLIRCGLLTVHSERRQALCDDLVDRLRTADYLKPLGERPLLLTMIAGLHATSGGSLPPGGRAALYERSVELLFDRWNEARQGRKPSEMLGMSIPRIRRALERLAFDVHQTRGVDAENGAEIQAGELWQALDHIRRPGEEGTDDKQIMNYLHQRSGILNGESATVYRFPHRSYQEFMAAGYLLRENFPSLLDEVVSADPTLWREVVQFAIGQQSNPPIGAWLILERLVPDETEEGIERDDPRWIRALLAGLAIRENELWQAPATPDRPKLERVRRWLRRAVELGALEVQDRAQAGQILGLLGDDRPGVGLSDDGLPSFEWVAISAGGFTMGGERYGDEKPVHEAHVDGFTVSRYPVTNGQYQAFVDDGGYTQRWRQCWTDDGWKDKGDRQGPRSVPPPFDLPNHPVVYTSWYEAVAFTNWLSQKAGVEHRLPTESEWERAARGTDGREYPWGPDFDDALCNAQETALGTTSAVGLFPGGECPAGNNGLGIRDASGNVWEWCATKHRKTYKEPEDNNLDGTAVRVLRGGSFASLNIDARCAARSWYHPDFINRDIGFRLVAPFEYL